jgi:hypothetical protein
MGEDKATPVVDAHGRWHLYKEPLRRRVIGVHDVRYGKPDVDDRCTHDPDGEGDRRLSQASSTWFCPS